MRAGSGCPDSPGDTIPHAKWRMCPGAHPALCLATVLPGGLQGEAESSGSWYGRIPPVPASQRPKSKRSASWRRPQPVAAVVSRRALTPSEFRLHPCCPPCRSARTKRDGLAPSGAQRWECLGYGCRYTSLTGAVFEHARCELAKWVPPIVFRTFSSRCPAPVVEASLPAGS